MSSNTIRLLAMIAAFRATGETGFAADVRFGYNENPPQMHRDSAGAAQGFVVDAINEAARRRGIRPEWIYLSGREVLDALRSGRIDVWPAGVSTPQRRREFHLSPPWWQGHAILLSREARLRSELAGKRVGHLASAAEAVRERLAEVQPVQMGNGAEMAASMCRGELDAILVDRLVADTLLLRRPEACDGLPLQIVVGININLGLGMIARRDRAGTAEEISSEMAEMTADGTLARIATDHPGISAASAGFVAGMVEQHYRLQTARALAGAVTVLLIAAVVVNWRLRRDLKLRRKAEHALRVRNADLAQFAYASHHDMGEPLRNMLLFSELLKRKGLSDPDAAVLLTFVTNNAERLRRMLDGVRQYTEAAGGEPGTESFESLEALEQAMEKLRGAIEASGAKVEKGPLPRVVYSRAQLVTVFENLLSNAITFRGAGPPRVRVSCEEKAGEFVFAVEDNGEGIAKEYRERIFGVFKRLHGHETAGTGMGLAICRRIVDNHGGRIWMESVPRGGSTFYFSVPARRRWKVA